MFFSIIWLTFKCYTLYADTASCFPNIEEVFETDDSFTLHRRNIRMPAIEVFKFFNKKILNKVFQVTLSAPYLLRNQLLLRNSWRMDWINLIFGAKNLVNSLSINKKLSMPKFYWKKSKETETIFFMSPT